MLAGPVFKCKIHESKTKASQINFLGKDWNLEGFKLWTFFCFIGIFICLVTFVQVIKGLGSGLGKLVCCREFFSILQHNH